jgi:hypothetical protein
VTLQCRYSLVGDGCLAEAAASCAAACDTFERMRDDQGVGTVKEAQAWCYPLNYNNISQMIVKLSATRCCLWRGRAIDALACVQAALAPYRAVNDEHSLLRCKSLEAFIRAMMGQVDEPRQLVREVVQRDVGVGMHVMVVCCALAVDAFVAHRHASASDAADDAAAAAANAAATALHRWSSSGCAPCDGWMAWAFIWLLTEVVCERLQLLPPAAITQFQDALSAFESYRRSAGARPCTRTLPSRVTRSRAPLAGTAVVVAAGRVRLDVAM